MEKPRIKVKPSMIDYSVEVAALLLIIISLVLPLFYSNEIVSKVPTHFNLYGQPDSYTKAGTLWLFPVIGLIVFIAFTILNKFPFIYRYPVKLTDANAERLHTLATRTIRILKLLLVLLLLCLNYDTIQDGLNESTESAKYYVPIFLIACITLVVIMFYKMKKN